MNMTATEINTQHKITFQPTFHKIKRFKTSFTVILLFLIFFGFYLNNLKALPLIGYWLNNRIFYSDTRNTYTGMQETSLVDNDTRKHPLFAIISRTSVSAMQTMFKMNHKLAVHSFLALIAAFNVIAVFFLLRRQSSNYFSVLLWTLFYGITFANIVFFGIPETYGLTTLSILIFSSHLISCRKNINTKNATVSGLLAGISALMNPPMIFLLIPFCYLAFKLPLKQFVSVSIKAALPAVLIFFGTNFLLFGTQYLKFSLGYADKWASLDNLTHITCHANVLLSFFVYSIISPLLHLSSSIGLQNFKDYIHPLIKIPIITLFLGYTVYAIQKTCRGLYLDMYNTIRQSSPGHFNHPAPAFLVWLLIMLLFYTYFNPQEAFLYSTQVLGPFVFILFVQYETLSWKWKHTVLVVFIICTAFFNIRCFYG